MIEIPAYRLAQAVGKGNTGPPAQLAFDLARVESITAVVSRTVGHVGDERRRLVHGFEEQARETEVGEFAAPAGVVDLAEPAAAPHAENCFAVVAYVDPIAHLQAVAVKGNRLVAQQMGNEARH